MGLNMDFKVGLGQDSHRINVKSNKPLILGGVLVDENIAVEANSDGDVILHAVFNALSTAIGGHSLGFYEKDLLGRGITDSREYLKFILEKVGKRGYQVHNLAVMVEAQRPKLESYHQKIQEKMAKLLATKKENIGLAFTSGEGLTDFGRGKGVQALAVVLLGKK